MVCPYNHIYMYMICSLLSKEIDNQSPEKYLILFDTFFFTLVFKYVKWFFKNNNKIIFWDEINIKYMF